MKKYLFLLCVTLVISTSCLAEVEKLSTTANTAEEKGEIDKAIGLYKKDIELNGEQAYTSMHRLGNIYRRAGEYNLGLQYYDMFLEIMPDANNVKAKRAFCYKMVNLDESFNKLKKLGTGLQLYASDNDGNYPTALKDLKIYWGTEDDMSVWAEENVKYLGKGLKATAPANTPIAYDKVMNRNIYSTGTVVLFNDSHAEFVKTDDLKKYNISKQQIMVEARVLHAEKELLDEFLQIDDSNAQALTLQALTLNDEQVEKLLEATKNSTDSNVINAPKLLVWDGESASVSALKDIMYIKDYLPAKDDKSKPEPITETVQSGIKLNVIPEITTCGGQEQIMLDVNMVSTDVEMKKFEHEGKSIELPTIDSTHIVSKVALQDGQTMVLGGIKGMESFGGPAYDKPKQIEMVVLLKAKKVD